jgi:hypothetical protein
MTKKQFKTRMTEFIRIKTEIEKVADVIHKSSLNEGNWAYPLGDGYWEALCLNTIADAMGGDEADWLGYWVYGCEMGTVKNINKMVSKDGKRVKFKTLDNLYDCIKDKGDHPTSKKIKNQ